MMIYDSFTAWINSFLACMGGCLGSSSKSSRTLLGDDAAKGRKSHGRTVSSMSDGFWTTSNHDVEHSVCVSQRSLSSISTSNQSLSDHGCSSTNGQNEFVNQGFLIWNRTRLQWTEGRMATNQPHETKESKIRCVCCPTSNQVHLITGWAFQCVHLVPSPIAIGASPTFIVKVTLNVLEGNGRRSPHCGERKHKYECW